MNLATGDHFTISEMDWDAFRAALDLRRDRVYSYLDAWPGTSNFRPADVHDALLSYIQRRGKALRPALLLLSCGAVGGDEEQALPAAAAVEVYHTWTLVHDDIIDRDETRRGSPTVHAQYTRLASRQHGVPVHEAAHYGVAVAILAGDLQQSWAYNLLVDLRKRGVDAGLVLDLVERMASSLTPELMEGEMLDVQYSLSATLDLTPDDILQMLSKKTATLLQYSAWAGARIGLGARPDAEGYAEKLGRFAYLCGTAFQLHDDLLGLTADAAKLGKPVGSDIREGKRTLVMFDALAHADSAERQAILAALGNPDASHGGIESALAAIRSTGAMDRVKLLAGDYIRQAREILGLLPDTEYRRLLAAWASFLLARQT